MLNDIEIPDHIEGEPKFEKGSGVKVFLYLILMTILLNILFLPSLMAFLFYGLFRLFLPRPPNVIHPQLLRYYLKQAWVVQTTTERLSFSMRLRITGGILLFLEISPFLGLCWFMDDIFFASYKKRKIKTPLFEISAARSGSTQIAHYIEEHPDILIPSVLQIAFPYIWAWKLAPLLKGIFTEERLLAIQKKVVREQFLQRHELHPLKTETFEAAFAIFHLLITGLLLGGEELCRSYGWGKSSPQTKVFWEGEMVEIMTHLGQKMLFCYDPEESKTVMFKGHFLSSADALQKRFPDAKFLTVIREPHKRIRSMINFMRVAPEMHLNGAVSWNSVNYFARRVEVDYCKLEQEWYSKDTANKTVIRFDDYVNDLENTMKLVYEKCLPQLDAQGHIPKEHPPRNRSNYDVNRSLEQLGWDVDELKKELSDYYNWCKGSSIVQ